MRYLKMFENFILNESKEVDFKLTELKNQKVSDLKNKMAEEGLKIHFKIEGKEYKYESPISNSGWGPKVDSEMHDSFLMWGGNLTDTISVGIGKETGKAQVILKFIEDTFKDGYSIEKKSSADFWEINIVPKK